MDKKFKITIGSSPLKPDGTNISDYLDHDLHLIKAALLYADKADVCSPMGNLIGSMNYFRKLAMSKNYDDKIKFLEEIDKQLHSTAEIPQFIYALKALKQKKHLSRDEILFKNKISKQIEKIWYEQYHNDFNKQGGDRLNVIMNLIENNLVNYYYFNVDEEKIKEELLQQFTSYISSSISDPYSYPLLDDLSGLLIQEQMQNGEIIINNSDLSRSKQVSLATKLFERLPNFDLASMDEIIDIRKELQLHLVQFRSSMIKFSETIETSQLNLDFEKDVENLFRKEIDPSIKTIEDEVKSKSYLKMLVSRFSEKPQLFPIPIFGIALAGQFFNYEMASLIFDGVTLSLNLLDIYNKWKEEKSFVEKNQLFFYYRAKKLLS